ncbi:hypothetical protein HMPREF0631_1346 [Peptostreptococcus anaerobius 653-L]|uniref:DUF4352 domain-containing protein n=1 Tax=Peptostreptococcus anaerobius 653-L TaxID=596329 RepID=D3MU40_9FIRM|nr:MULTISPECIES: hypothetical protein [Peptostreptococcus]EFD04294.1 hypothetical protein HMPREF0631_1346 [Peptostreptococcus anaerobius 653-L]MBS5595694.1 hypothetical protein [Peptostreptococcus sp.]
MYNNFSLTTFISTIGLILSLVSLTIHYLNYRSSQSRMKFEILSNSYYCKAKDFSITNFESEYFALISVKISNVSSLPITIDEVYLNERFLNGGHYNELKYTVPEIPNSKFISYFKTPHEALSYSIEPLSDATLPLRIEPYDTKSHCFKIPFDSHINRKSHKLFISTPRKTYKVDLTLKEYHELVRLDMNSELPTE